jgi:hypothetical protein
MRILRYITLSLALSSGFSTADNYGKFETYIPENQKVIADVMIISTPTAVQELVSRFQAALKENPAWFKEYLSKAEKGKPLVFHKNFGISQKEYEYILAESKKMQLVKVSDTELNFTLTEKNDLVITGLPAKQPHHKLIYNIETDTVSIADTRLDVYSEINQTKTSSPTGRWQGKQWAYKLMNSESDFKSIKFAIGTQKDEPRNIIYYDVKMAINGQSANLTYILLYDIQ